MHVISAVNFISVLSQIVSSIVQTFDRLVTSVANLYYQVIQNNTLSVIAMLYLIILDPKFKILQLHPSYLFGSLNRKQFNIGVERTEKICVGSGIGYIS